MILQSSCHGTISCLFFRSVVTCLNWKCFLMLHLQSWSWLIIIWLELFNFQSNTESSDSNSNTAMVIDDLTQVITTIILLQTQQITRFTDETAINMWWDSLVVPVRGKHTHGASWSIKEPSYCGSDWVHCLLYCSIKQFPGAGADQLGSHNTQTTTESGETTINIVTIISCDTGTNTILSWEH